MNQTQLRGKTALVTGASSGLGVEFARQLAAMGCNLILTARRLNLLEKVKREIEKESKIQVTLLPMDLSTQEAPQELYEKTKEQGKTVDILVNNAGFGLYGNFDAIPWQREQQMLHVNLVNLVYLTKLFAKDMINRDYGRIAQIASTGAYQPTPTYAAYAATKAFVLNYGEAVNHELRGTNVYCTVVSPGVTATEFLQVSGQNPTFYQRLTMMKSEDVVRIGIRKMLAGRSSVVTGNFNHIMAFFIRFIPRNIVTATAALLMKNK